ncbi:hypothetical protein CP97_13145 [Aurantiacibacter atlanticus]|uniref:Uncharacterized protein n=1 Tax=Aurantiacibacter atlanticus TaxID=1648404 RepID=A0A0H4VIU4_9SPHN|nr:hypothetical protein CP97_13145 [Aurantiacibacter atlanticus]
MGDIRELSFANVLTMAIDKSFCQPRDRGRANNDERGK